MRKKSDILFGRLLIIGLIDHTQILPINQLPLLTLWLILTCFEAVELFHSIKAYEDPNLSNYRY